MKKLLNKLAIWLYKKTREKIQSPNSFFGGIKVIETSYLPKGTCYMGTGDVREMNKVFLDKEIKLDK